MSNIDWGGLADSMGTVTRTDHGFNEMGGTDIAARALVAILGDDALIDAVDYYLSHQPGAELAKSVLRLLSPPAAMNRCLTRFRSAAHPEEAADAIELLRHVADSRVMGWIDEFMGSDVVAVRAWAIGIVDQLLFRDAIGFEEAEPVIARGLADPDEWVRQQAVLLQEMITRDRELAMGEGENSI